MLDEAAVEPKERNIWEGLSEVGKKKRIQERKRISAKKQSRRASFDD